MKDRPKKFYLVANWKMNKTVREANFFIESLIPELGMNGVHVYIAPPFMAIASSVQYARDTSIVIGAQNMHDARDGAFTGEIAAFMLREAGAAFVILGHSERRHLFGETNAFIHRKVVRALQDDLQAIVCVGEKEGEEPEEILREQIMTAFEKVPAEESEKILLAYEPVWAIGTGKTPTPKQIQEMHGFCRKLLQELFGKKRGEGIPILYGGSVNVNNAVAISQEPDVDGLLVGGASLDPQKFIQMIQLVSKNQPEKYV